MEGGGVVAHGEDHRPGPVPHFEFVEGPSGERRAVPHRDLPEFRLEGAVVDDDVDEVGHVGLGGQAGHAEAADLVGVDHPVGANLVHLGDTFRVVGPRDDEHLRVEIAGAEGDVEVVDGGAQCHHECGRPFDAGPAEHIVGGGVADQEQGVVRDDPFLVDVHHDDLLADGTDEGGD